MVEYFKTLDGRFNVYFLRHGESQGNSARIIQGRHDLPLSTAGLKESEAVASWFVDRQIDVILSSPLRRALQTAEAVGRVLGSRPVQPHDGLNELDTGIFTGLTVEQIRRRYPGAWRDFQRSSWEGVPEAEKIEELLGRTELMWKDLGSLFSEGAKNLLCVTHSGILQWIIKATFGQHSWMPLVPVENCSICHFSLDNNLKNEQPRYYFEWTRLNYRPISAAKSSGHMFLDA
ncbi:MAG: histidine phosphatase family protein [Spirochaetaceae bacterium]|nr:MAG: histidine phosphatase family protein [Spirochaetaceae bacterium]